MVEYGQGNGLVLPELVAVDETAGDFAALERVGRRWEQKFAAIERDEPRAERCGDDGTLDLLIVAYGSLARIAEYSLPQLRAAGMRVGVIRPITLWPFPAEAVRVGMRGRELGRRRRAQHGTDDPRRRRGDRSATRRLRQLARWSRSVDGGVRRTGHRATSANCNEELSR